MEREGGWRFQISIINEETNNTFVPLTVNLLECCQLPAQKESHRKVEFPLTHQPLCLSLKMLCLTKLHYMATSYW